MQFRQWRLAAAAAALVLASCGGGSSPQFSRMVAFGDSLSDVGTYRVGSIAALGGGRWTVNGPGAMNWTEVVASEIGVAAPCAAQTGLLPNIPGIVGAAVTDVPACTSYAQGSSRVTQAIGPNSAALQQAPFNQVTLGLMAIPLTMQVNNHLARVGSFSGTELVTVLAGGNDIFMNFAAIASASAGGSSAVGAAFAAGWPADVQAAVAAGGAVATNAAVNAAVAAMGQAGAELAALVRNQLLARGARYVVVVNLPDTALTPFGMSLAAEQRRLLTSLTDSFNSQLAAGLSNSGALYVDFFAQQQVIAANAAAHGLTNTTTPACDPGSPANPLLGSSIACTAASTLAADTSGYQYADSVHPTSLGYRLIAEYVLAQMRTVKWL